ncbi:MAG: LysR substrate-binding domain-containing protein [Actinomycetota bacterium]
MHDERIPDRWLRVFVSAAHRGNFTTAAADLGIGQPAVSHTIRRLEEVLGYPVFTRGPAGASLTDAGRMLFDGVNDAFARLDDAVRAARRADGSDAVGLAVSTSLATYWLLPRLPEFKTRHPDIELRVSTDDTDLSVGADGADIWIPHGHGDWPGFDRWHLATETIYPVAARGLAGAGAWGVDRMFDELPLLHLDERYRPRMDWTTWRDAVSGQGDVPTGAHFSDYTLVLHAAMSGQGVALGWHHIVEPLVAAGQLVRLTDAIVTTERPFEVLARADRPLSAAAAALRDWLIEEAAAPADVT